MSEYEDAFESESDAYACFDRGHIDGSKKPMEYKPLSVLKMRINTGALFNKRPKILKTSSFRVCSFRPNARRILDRSGMKLLHLSQTLTITIMSLLTSHLMLISPQKITSKDSRWGERYAHRYHHDPDFDNNYRRTDKTVWTSQVNPRTGKWIVPFGKQT